MSKIIEYEGCEIARNQYFYEQQTGIKKTIFRVTHKHSNWILHAVNITEAYKIARLLNLDHCIGAFYPLQNQVVDNKEL